MKFSVIIVARALNDYLKESISHLKRVRYYDFEVIIVLDKVEFFRFGPKERRFRIIAAKDFGPAQKRNQGAQEATGDILAFIDDDAYPDVYWLRQAANIFEEMSDLYALGGPGLTPQEVPLKERISGRILESYLASGNTTFRHKQEKRREVVDHPTVNLFVKKEAFEQVGGFDENSWPGEDTKLCLDLVKKFGKPFLYDPEPVVYHHRRPVLKEHLTQMSRYGMHRGRFAKIFPGNSRRLSYFIPAFFVLGLIFGPIVSIFIPRLFQVYLVLVFVYLLMAFVEAQKVSMNEKDAGAFIYMFLGTTGTNLVYGVNFIKGLLFKPPLKLREVDEGGNYVGG